MPDPRAQLEARLRALGLRGVDVVRLHANRVVMLSLRRRVLRIHGGYAWAPDHVLEAVVRFLRPRSRRAARRAAERVFLKFPAHEFLPPRRTGRRPERPRAGDTAILARLREAHSRLNVERFGGRLDEIPLRLSGRMERRLGDLELDPAGRAVAITLSRRHLARDTWTEVESTLLHEMIHQWQAAAGRSVDHRAGFRRKAREVGLALR